MIPLECPYCFAPLEIGDDRGGRSMTCPFCKGQVQVPKPHKPKRPRRYDEYELEDDDAALQGSLVSRGKLSEAEIESLEDEEPEKKKRRRPKMEWRLFLGGFAFPWSPGAVMQWLLIGLWGTMAGWLARMAFVFGVNRPLAESSLYETIVALLAALGALLAGVASAAVAAIYGLTILLETTAGNDRMENWPNVGLFLDWVDQLWFIVNTAVVSGLLGLGLDWLLPGLLGTRESTVAVDGFLPVSHFPALHLGDRLAVLADFGFRPRQPGTPRTCVAGLLRPGRRPAGGGRGGGLLPRPAT